MLDKKKYTEFYLKTFKSEIRFHPKSRLAAPGYEQPGPIEKEYNQEKIHKTIMKFQNSMNKCLSWPVDTIVWFLPAATSLTFSGFKPVEKSWTVMISLLFHPF